MSKTNTGLVAWALKAVSDGWVYCYGTYGNLFTVSKYSEKRRQYPSHYTEDRHETYLEYIKQHKIATDCVGLIKSYLWELDGVIQYKRDGIPDVSAKGMYNRCSEKGRIADGIPHIPGVLVFNKDKSHVGIYDGHGRVIEAQSFAKKVRVNTLASRPTFTLWGICPDIKYAEGETEVPETAPEINTGKEVPGVPTIRKGCEGVAVQIMQKLLIVHGLSLPKYGPDGDYGTETENAVKKFQHDNKLTPDGICGPKTWAALAK